MALAEALLPRMHVAERLLSLHRAQPAPPLHTRRVLPAQSAERKRGRWLREGSRAGVVASGGVGWGRWDGLIGYGIPTAGRLCAAPIAAVAAWPDTTWPTL